jgi:multiple sugar transport system permease protein
MISVCLVWSWLFDTRMGLVNGLLSALHATPWPWLQHPATALAMIILLRVWKNMGYTVILFCAGLQNISQDLYESASLDGAGPWQQFFKITLPLMTPTLFFVLMVTLMSSFQVFDAIYLMTQGGPNHSTDVLVYWIYKNAFEFYKAGSASAMAYILFIIILGLTLIQWWGRKKWVLQEVGS